MMVMLLTERGTQTEVIYVWGRGGNEPHYFQWKHPEEICLYKQPCDRHPHTCSLGDLCKGFYGVLMRNGTAESYLRCKIVPMRTHEQLFRKALPFYAPTSSGWEFMSLLILDMIPLSNVCQSDKCTVVSHGCFQIHSSRNISSYIHKRADLFPYWIAWSYSFVHFFFLTGFLAFAHLFIVHFLC